jgi:hypothetical protein
MNNSKTSDTASVTLIRGASNMDEMKAIGRFTAVCLDEQGNVKWQEEFDNLVTTQGRNHLLDHGITGPGTAVLNRMSYITSGTPVNGDTYATHAGFTELGSGVIATRTTPTWNAAASGSRATSAASASIIGSGTVTGVAINLVVGSIGTLGSVADTATSGGILYSAGLFGSSRSVTNGDTLNVTYTTSLT